MDIFGVGANKPLKSLSIVFLPSGGPCGGLDSGVVQLSRLTLPCGASCVKVVLQVVESFFVWSGLTSPS